MGVGTLAAYGQAGDFYRFYEIDPVVIHFSEGPHPYFTFVKDSPAKVETQVGDGRLSLEHELSQGQPQKYDVLIVDAFAAMPFRCICSRAKPWKSTRRNCAARIASSRFTFRIGIWISPRLWSDSEIRSR